MSKNPPILIVPDSQITELKKQYKQERDRRITERIHCIILAAQGYDWKELKRILLPIVTNVLNSPVPEPGFWPLQLYLELPNRFSQSLRNL